MSVYRLSVNSEIAFTILVALDERVRAEVFGDLVYADGSPDRTDRGAVVMLPFVRRSLLVQLLSVYLLFVIVVLLGGVEVNAVVEQQLRNDVQASDQALAQEIALQTSLQLQSAENSLVKLGSLVQDSTPGTMAKTFRQSKLKSIESPGEPILRMENILRASASSQVTITPTKLGGLYSKSSARALRLSNNGSRTANVGGSGTSEESG